MRYTFKGKNYDGGPAAETGGEGGEGKQEVLMAVLESYPGRFSRTKEKGGGN